MTILRSVGFLTIVLLLVMVWTPGGTWAGPNGGEKAKDAGAKEAGARETGGPSAAPHAAAPEAAGQVREGVRETPAQFDSGGKPIDVQVFAPAEPAGAGARRPCVLVVHGADGLAFKAWYEIACRQLARDGYVALLVHYFQRTDTGHGDAATNAKFFTAWMGTLGDALTWAAGRADVDPRRLGLLGFSLGSYLSLSQSAFDPRVRCVVEYFGGMPPLVAATMKRMPPVLILHGEADPIVPVAEARRLEKLLKEKGATYEVKLYPGQGHGFAGAPAADAATRTIAFFDKYLKGPKKE